MRSYLQLCFTLARAILTDTKVRRQWMFVSTLAVLGFVFGGYFLAGSFLAAHPVIFALYVLASLAGLALLMLFALFDFLKVRESLVTEQKKVAREAMRRLREEVPPARPPSDDS